MNFYRITDTAQDSRPDYKARFACTLQAAHDYAKATPKVSWLDIRVELVDFETQKADVCNMLNDEVPVVPSAMRTWSLTPRGGLVECENGQ